MFCSRTKLTPCHSIDVVIDAHNGQIDISTTRVNQMITANSSDIAIAAHYYDFQLRIGNLYTFCECNSSSMSGMDCTCLEVP